MTDDDDPTLSHVLTFADGGGMRRMTWREVAEQATRRADLARAEAERYARFYSLVSDLDRCPHGRHEQDHCSGCEPRPADEIPRGHPWNTGNPYLEPGQRIGTSLHATHAIVVPAHDRQTDPEAWYVHMDEYTDPDS